MRTSERTTARLFVRLRPRDKAVLEEAAIAEGVDLSVLVRDGAMRYAKSLIRLHRRRSGAAQKMVDRLGT